MLRLLVDEISISKQPDGQIFIRLFDKEVLQKTYEVSEASFNQIKIIVLKQFEKA